MVTSVLKCMDDIIWREGASLRHAMPCRESIHVSGKCRGKYEGQASKLAHPASVSDVHAPACDMQIASISLEKAGMRVRFMQQSC